MPEAKLSTNQEQFVRDAKQQGFKVDYGYSGRCMYGRTCPSVTVESPGDFATSADTSWDNMGLVFVIYASQ